MCTILVNGCSKIANGITSIVKGGFDAVSGSYSCLGRHIKRITDDRLHPCLAKTVQQVFDSLPYTVLTLVAVKRTPSYITFPLMVGYASAHICRDWIFEPQTYKNLWHGMGNASMYCALQNTARFVLTKNPVFAAVATVELTLSQLAHTRADALKTVDVENA